MAGIVLFYCWRAAIVAALLYIQLLSCRRHLLENSSTVLFISAGYVLPYPPSKNRTACRDQISVLAPEAMASDGSSSDCLTPNTSLVAYTSPFILNSNRYNQVILFEAELDEVNEHLTKLDFIASIGSARLPSQAVSTSSSTPLSAPILQQQFASLDLNQEGQAPQSFSLDGDRECFGKELTKFPQMAINQGYFTFEVPNPHVFRANTWTDQYYSNLEHRTRILSWLSTSTSMESAWSRLHRIKN